MTKLEGDRDVFGDGSVSILSTPGHTPGHQSLLVRLPKTGALVLSGDAVHFRDNWDNRRVPSMNIDKEQTLASMQKIADTLAKDKAQLWINTTSSARRLEDVARVLRLSANSRRGDGLDLDHEIGTVEFRDLDQRHRRRGRRRRRRQRSGFAPRGSGRDCPCRSETR